MKNYSNIDEYLAILGEAEKIELERVRQIVKTTVPEAVEVISYGMPGFKYKGKYLLGFAAFKDHLSFFPTAEPIEVLKDKLSGYKLSKGTVQYSLNNPIPEFLIKELISIRIKNI